MLFNSLHFILLFFPVAVTGFYLLPHRFRWFWLLALSAYFYMAFVPYYILILAVTILVDYVAGILISRTAGARKRMWLTLSIVANVGVLAFFKYFAFLRENLLLAGRLLGHEWPIPALSVTFQSMSYTIEVYRGNQAPERNLGIFALYVLFFPQLVAGPIERPQNLLHQFREKHHFDYDAVSSGVKLIVWGLFQKMVIADRLAPIVDGIYTHPGDFSGLTLALATALFAFQIFCDFAGYSDVAIGTAQVLGFKLMTNFNQPYLARSVAEFWKRWHISLSTWFRDYLYVPLGGNRKGPWRHVVNVLIVFAVSGLWHGADWKFVIWGALNGLFVVMTGLRPGKKVQGQRTVPALVRRIVTFVLIFPRELARRISYNLPAPAALAAGRGPGKHREGAVDYRAQPGRVRHIHARGPGARPRTRIDFAPAGMAQVERLHRGDDGHFAVWRVPFAGFYLLPVLELYDAEYACPRPRRVSALRGLGCLRP